MRSRIKKNTKISQNSGNSEKIKIKKNKLSSKKITVKEKVPEKKKTKKNKLEPYCKACMIIRLGPENSPAEMQGKYFPHTCGKNEEELKEFTTWMKMSNRLNKKGDRNAVDDFD